MPTSIRTRAEDVRALAGAIMLGSCAGLVVGVACLVGGGARPSPHVAPAPSASGPPQAMASPTPQASGDRLKLASVAAAVPRSSPAPIRPELALRDRFRVAVQAFHAAARPLHLQLADAPSDLHCLTEAVYFEARGEAPAGQQAVAQVVLNRVRHPAFPKTICAVVHQHTGASCQFSFACSRQPSPIEGVAWRRAEAIASGEIHGAVMAAVGDATQFQAARASPFAGLMKVAQVGAHIFYRFGGHAVAPAVFHQTPVALAEPTRIEVARLDLAPAAKGLQPAFDEGQARATLYPPSAKPPLAAIEPEAVAVKLASAPKAEARPSPAPPASGGAASSSSPPVKAADGSAARPAVISVALAQS